MEKTHIALPNSTFKKIIDVLNSLPHGQIRPLFDEIQATGAEVNISAPEESEKREE
jgi:hypothetical protein